MYHSMDFSQAYTGKRNSRWGRNRSVYNRIFSKEIHVIPVGTAEGLYEGSAVGFTEGDAVGEGLGLAEGSA